MTVGTVTHQLNIFDKWKNTDDFRRILDACKHTGYIPSFSLCGTLKLEPETEDVWQVCPYFNKFKLDIDLYQTRESGSNEIVAKFRVAIKAKATIFNSDTSAVEMKEYASYTEYISNLVFTIQTASFRYSDLGQHNL